MGAGILTFKLILKHYILPSHRPPTASPGKPSRAAPRLRRSHTRYPGPAWARPTSQLGRAAPAPTQPPVSASQRETTPLGGMHASRVFSGPGCQQPPCCVPPGLKEPTGWGAERYTLEPQAVPPRRSPPEERPRENSAPNTHPLLRCGAQNRICLLRICLIPLRDDSCQGLSGHR